MNLTKNGVTIEISDATVVAMVLERLAGSAYPVNLKTMALPRIGTYWAGQGGIFTGIMRGRDNAPDYALLTAQIKVGKKNWKDGCEWAASIEIDGHRDFTLALRAEQSLQFANIPEEFEKDYYWSCEQRAGYSGGAWGQGFSSGGQHYWGKVNDGLVCAVRRLSIQ